MRDGRLVAAGRDEGDQAVEGADERGEAEHLLGGGGVLAAEKVLLLEVGADGVDAERAGDERDADGLERGGRRDVTEGEEHDAGDEDRGGEPLLPVVLLADDEHGEGHHGHDLRRLEHDARRVVEVRERVVGHRHATVGVHGEDTVVLPGRLAGVAGELHLERAAQEVREGGEHRHPRRELETGDAEHALLQRGEAERGAEGAAREDQEGQRLGLGKRQAEHLLGFAGSRLGDAAGVAAENTRGEKVSFVSQPLFSIPRRDCLLTCRPHARAARDTWPRRRAFSRAPKPCAIGRPRAARDARPEVRPGVPRAREEGTRARPRGGDSGGFSGRGRTTRGTCGRRRSAARERPSRKRRSSSCGRRRRRRRWTRRARPRRAR